MIVGIDLGTTNSLIGKIEKGRPRLFTGSNQQTLVPSVVFFDGEKTPIVGAEARKRRAEFPSKTIFSAKRFLGRGVADVKEWAKSLPFDLSRSDDQMIRFGVGERVYTPIEIASLVLKELKLLAQTQSGEKVDKAVITVPAYFNDSQRQATKIAGELAGLEVVRIINEPTAACLAYGLDKKAKGTVAVFDLGGGTFDISILRIQEGLIEVLATNGDTALGGDDFDLAIAEHFKAGAEKVLGIQFALHPELRGHLIEAAELAKRNLTEAETTQFYLQHSGREFSAPFTREDLNTILAPILLRASEPCRQCLKDAKVAATDLTDVILVGGSTRSPEVRQFVKDLFAREPICTLNPDEVVAMGATVQANVLSGQMGEMLLLDVIPLTLGIETVGGVVSRIIHRNSTIPTSASENFTTSVEGQTSVDIHVLQGERELVKDNRSLARFQLRGLPPLPAGIPKIEVEFIVDANGILNVRATELRTRLSTAVQVNPSYGLTDTEVETMLESAFENAEADFAARFLAEAKTEAEHIITATEKALDRRGYLVEGEERTQITEALKRLTESLTSEDHRLIKEKIEVLNTASQRLAERILNVSVQEAMQGKTVDTLSGDKT